MSSAQKKPGGQFLVLIIVLVAGLAAWGSRIHYNARHPASMEAQIFDERSVTATFNQADQQIIRQGMRVTISLQGKKFEATVGKDTPEDNKMFITGLTPPAIGISPGTPCKVVVDTTVPPELLKGAN